MSNSTTIEIQLDDTVKYNVFFQSITSIEINKAELFKYAIMMWEVPKNIRESDFTYLQSKVPALEMLLSDHIEFSSDTIFNLSTDDRVKKLVSEAVGVGIGLKYSIVLLNTNPSKLKKIDAPSEGKYLDYATIVDSREYEIETKGTVSNYYANMKKDILEKKQSRASKNVHLRFGTICMLKNVGQTNKSNCIIVDDPPNDNNIDNDDTFNTQLWSYATILSHIIDSKYYNKFVNPLIQGKIGRIRINNRKFFGKYIFENKLYLGECFDYRLIKENIRELDLDKNKKDALFQLITQNIGVTKFFIGLHIDVISAINRKNEVFLRQYESEVRFVDKHETIKFLDKDGILIIKSRNHSDAQLEEIFSEDEVEKRLGLFSNYLQGYAHKCGVPCKSKALKGKPCDMMTFREACHFHR